MHKTMALLKHLLLAELVLEKALIQLTAADPTTLLRLLEVPTNKQSIRILAIKPLHQDPTNWINMPATPMLFRGGC